MDAHYTRNYGFDQLIFVNVVESIKRARELHLHTCTIECNFFPSDNHVDSICHI